LSPRNERIGLRWRQSDVEFTARADRGYNNSEESERRLPPDRLRGAPFVVAEHAAEARIANDSLAWFERVVDLGPTVRKWPVANALMGPERCCSSQSRKK